MDHIENPPEVEPKTILDEKIIQLISDELDNYYNHSLPDNKTEHNTIKVLDANGLKLKNIPNEILK